MGRALLARLEARALAIAAEQSLPPAVPAYWQGFTTEKSIATVALLEHAGDAPVRYFYEMVRPNLDDIPDVRLPAGPKCARPSPTTRPFG